MATSTAASFSSLRPVTRRSRLALGIVLMLSRLTAERRRSPSSGPKSTSERMLRTRVVTDATVTNCRTAYPASRERTYRSERLPGLDSNQGLQLQRLTCYRYTTGHCNQGGRRTLGAACPQGIGLFPRRREVRPLLSPAEGAMDLRSRNPPPTPRRRAEARPSAPNGPFREFPCR